MNSSIVMSGGNPSTYKSLWFSTTSGSSPYIYIYIFVVCYFLLFLLFNPKKEFFSSLIPHPSSLIPHPSSLIPHPSSLILPGYGQRDAGIMDAAASAWTDAAEAFGE